MKLLTRQEITKQKTAERKIEIDEGIKLARKVDTLRQTALQEEANLAKFRLAALQRTKEEIEALVQQKDNVVSEIESLKVQRDLLRLPLDGEWDQLMAFKEETGKLNDLLSQKEAELSHQGFILGQKSAELSLMVAKLDNEKALAHINFLETEENKQKSAETVVENEVIKTNLELYVNKKTEEFVLREGDLAAREKEINLKEDSYRKRLKALNIKEQIINDRFETLLRTEKGLK